MINLIVFFGGVSCEHDISIITGEQFIANCNALKYNVIPVYIDKDGNWWTGENLKDIDKFQQNLHKCKMCAILPSPKGLYIKKGKKYIFKCVVDVAILCVHGKNGEDGSLAGLMELYGIPYSSSGICGSAVCLDKYICKNLSIACDIPVVSGVLVTTDDWLADIENCLDGIEKLGFPVILKPSRLGSSIGIVVCYNQSDLYDKMKECFQYDDRVLVERFVNVDKEINIALFDDKGELVFSNTEEPISHDEILSFDEKYRKNAGGFASIKRISPANIDNELDLKIREIASRCYRNFNLFGIVRFDFILDKSGNLYLNEINAIPGSMAYYLFDKSKYSYGVLIDMMISGAVHRKKNNNKLIKTIETDVIDNDFDGFKK